MSRKIKVDKAVSGSNLNSVLDLTRPTANFTGSTHPITKINNQINEIFKSLGFYISSGPEIEDDWHNFEALNLPKDHPARDMQDTFFIKTQPDILLRTHTSSVQVRHMSENQPLLEPFLQVEFLETKLFPLELTVFFIKLRGYILIKV